MNTDLCGEGTFLKATHASSIESKYVVPDFLQKSNCESSKSAVGSLIRASASPKRLASTPHPQRHSDNHLHQTSQPHHSLRLPMQTASPNTCTCTKASPNRSLKIGIWAETCAATMGHLRKTTLRTPMAGGCKALTFSKNGLWFSL